MAGMTRRSLINSSVGLVAAGAVGAAPYRQGAGQDRRGLVAQGFAGRGCRLQENVDGISEGQRQHDRPQHHAVCADAPEDRLGGDQRRRPGYVPNNPTNSSRCSPGRTSWSTSATSSRRNGGVRRDRAVNVNCYNNVRKTASIMGSP